MNHETQQRGGDPGKQPALFKLPSCTDGLGRDPVIRDKDNSGHVVQPALAGATAPASPDWGVSSLKMLTGIYCLHDSQYGCCLLPSWLLSRQGTSSPQPTGPRLGEGAARSWL